MLPDCTHPATDDRALSDRFEIYCLECGEVIEAVTFDELMAGRPPELEPGVPPFQCEEADVP